MILVALFNILRSCFFLIFQGLHHPLALLRLLYASLILQISSGKIIFKCSINIFIVGDLNEAGSFLNDTSFYSRVFIGIALLVSGLPGVLIHELTQRGL